MRVVLSRPTGYWGTLIRADLLAKPQEMYTGASKWGTSRL